MNPDENFTPDPSQQDDFNVGQGDAPETGAEEPQLNSDDFDDGIKKSDPENVSVEASIAEELSSSENPEQEGEGVAEPSSPTAFDISKLSKEQIQQLKQMLNATPDSIQRKRENPKVKLRKIDNNIVIDFNNAYLGLVKDPANNREVEKHIIPVKFLGSEEYTPILYSKFINSERVDCEILGIKQKKNEIVEGETISRETGTLVDMIRVQIETTFEIKLPNGEVLEIPAKMANA